MDANYTRAYEEFEKKHWWHVARGELIRWAIDHYVPDLDRARWLDVGCGAGVLLEQYTRISPERKLGLEMDGGCVEAARAKGLDVRQVGPQWDFTAYGQFDLVTLCDVIEHVEDDFAAIEAVRAVLNTGGTALITVPALMSLWSAHDVRNHHFRRYAKPDLVARFPKDRWKVQRLTYFSSFLLPMIWGFRTLKKLRYGTNPSVAADDKHYGPKAVDASLLAIFRIECLSLHTVSMPLGSSLLLVVRKV